MFHSYQLRINSKILFLIIFLCLIIHVNSSFQFRYRRDIGGESLDTSNFVLTIDVNGSRFIEVPREYMINWLDDQIMWRTWSIILAIVCVILFGALLFFLIYGFCTSTGPFADCTRCFYESSSDEKLTTSEMAFQIDETSKIDSSLSKPITHTVSHPLVPLKTMGPSYLK